MLDLQPSLSDHTYKVHVVDGGLQYVNGAFGNPYRYLCENLDFHVMSLRTIDVIFGYPSLAFKSEFLVIHCLNVSFGIIFSK